ncbi:MULTISPECIES: ROK family protein [Natrialbaceae]|uniref:ROK family protein n=1 Tax=Natrialbaceae TaxID=1644061 RepID=UPI00207D572F|nr:ROK family protein [Natronococcus sp. CG52]
MDFIGLVSIGSTNFRYTAATPAGDFLTDIVVESTQPRQLAAQLGAAIDDLQATAALDAVSISAPGLIDAETGKIRKLDTPDGDVIDHVDIRAPLQRQYDLPIYLENDCTASALGEWHFGAREDHDCVIHLTIGTGIGGGVVDRGHLLRGDSAQAGEFGLIPVAPDSDLESTGVTGAWEAFCSGRGIPDYVCHRFSTDEDWADSTRDSEFRQTLAAGDNLAAPAVFDAADRGDRFAQACLEQVGRYNAVGIAAICNAFNPGLITLGGGVALNNSEWLLEGIDSSLDEFLFVDRPAIRLTPLGDDIGLYGSLGVVADRSPASRSGDSGRSVNGTLD